MAEPTRERLLAIDALRGLASLCVVLSHYLPFWHSRDPSLPVVVPNAWGEHAVMLFFAISGFVIFGTLRGCGTLLDFAVNRFSRIYPTHWVTMGFVACVLALAGEPPRLGDLAVNATLLQDLVGAGRFDNVYWSLTVELCFYVLAACLFVAGRHTRPLPFVAAWLVASAAWALSTTTRDFDERGLATALLVLDYAPYFAIGIALYEAHRSGWSNAARAVLVLALAGAWLGGGARALAVAVGATLLMWLASSGRAAWLVNRPLLWLGTISYALYLVHRNLGYEALRWFHAHDVSPAVALPVTIVGALVLAAAITYAVERPASAAIRRLYGRRAVRAPAAAGRDAGSNVR